MNTETTAVEATKKPRKPLNQAQLAASFRNWVHAFVIKAIATNLAKVQRYYKTPEIDSVVSDINEQLEVLGVAVDRAWERERQFLNPELRKDEERKAA